MAEQKEKLGHGEWLLWLEMNCPAITRNTAWRYMRAHERYGALVKQGQVDSQCLTDLYRATGILPEPEPHAATEPKSTAPQWMGWMERIQILAPTVTGEQKEILREYLRKVLALL